MASSEPRTTTPLDLNSAELEIIGRVFRVDCQVIIRGDRVTLDERQTPSAEYDQVDSPENVHTRVLVKMPGLGRVLRACSHATIGGPVGSIRVATVTGEIRPSEVPPFRWMLMNISSIVVHVPASVRSFPPVVELDLSNVGVYTQAEIDDLDRGVSKHIPESRILELKRRRAW